MITFDQKSAIQRLVEKMPVEVIYLFGSRAYNQQNAQSDYDFGVLFSKDQNSSQRFDLRLKLYTDIPEIVRTDDVDILDLNQSPIRFQYEAIKPRQDIYVRNSKIRDEFEYEVLTNYLDEVYYLKQSTNDYLHQVAQNGIF